MIWTLEVYYTNSNLIRKEYCHKLIILYKTNPLDKYLRNQLDNDKIIDWDQDQWSDNVDILNNFNNSARLLEKCEKY